MCVIKKGLLGSILGFFSISLAKAQTTPTPNAMNVLFIGNSYTHMNKMPELFEKIATSKKMKISVTMDAKSNHTFKMHCERPELFKTINSTKWDYVVIQGFSRELMYDFTQIDTATIPYFNKIVDSVYKNNPCTNILLYMTWGYKEGSLLIPETDTYTKMCQRIASGYNYLSKIYDLPIVPVGDVHQAVRATFPDYELYQEDKQHPTLLASYMIASTFYSAIFKNSPLNAYIPSGLDLKKAENIQKTAYSVVSKSIDKYDLRKNTLDVKFERTKTGAYFAYCKSYYANAKSVLWEFGDGTKSTQRNVVHQYKYEGEYMIKLTVHDQCGTREIYRKVYFKKPAPPVKSSGTKPATGGGKKKI